MVFLWTTLGTGTARPVKSAVSGARARLASMHATVGFAALRRLLRRAGPCAALLTARRSRFARATFVSAVAPARSCWGVFFSHCPDGFNPPPPAHCTDCNPGCIKGRCNENWKCECNPGWAGVACERFVGA